MSYPTLSSATQYWGIYGQLDLLLVWSDNHVEVVVEEWYKEEAAARGFAEAMHWQRPFC
jgi:cytosine/adenosine deaminase-related metal-dependent hydrolase